MPSTPESSPASDLGVRRKSCRAATRSPEFLELMPAVVDVYRYIATTYLLDQVNE